MLLQMWYLSGDVPVHWICAENRVIARGIAQVAFGGRGVIGTPKGYPKPGDACLTQAPPAEIPGPRVITLEDGSSVSKPPHPGDLARAMARQKFNYERGTVPSR